jgi:uncharacterized protein YhaN
MSETLECTEKVISSLLMEIAQLKEENDELKQARDHYKYNYELLHNKLQNKIEIEEMNKEYEKVAKEGFADMQDLEKAYANWGYTYEADIESIR